MRRCNRVVFEGGQAFWVPVISDIIARMLLLQALRQSKWIARCVLVWFALSMAVAVAAPDVNPQATVLVCSAAGAVKLVNAGGRCSPAHGPARTRLRVVSGTQCAPCHACSRAGSPEWPVICPEGGASGFCGLAHRISPACARPPRPLIHHRRCCSNAAAAQAPHRADMRRFGNPLLR